jgi:hypothetical protein
MRPGFEFFRASSKLICRSQEKPRLEDAGGVAKAWQV